MNGRTKVGAKLTSKGETVMNNKEEPGGFHEQQPNSDNGVDPLPKSRNFVRYLDLGIHLICRQGPALPCFFDILPGKLRVSSRDS